MDEREFRGSDNLSHVGNRVVPRPSSSVSYSYMISAKEYGLCPHLLVLCGDKVAMKISVVLLGVIQVQWLYCLVNVTDP